MRSLRSTRNGIEPLKGVDRLQYKSYSSLEDELERLISQILPPPKDEEAETFLTRLQDKIVELLVRTPNLGVSTIAPAVGVNIDLAKLVKKMSSAIALTPRAIQRVRNTSR